MGLPQITVAVTGLNNIDSPGPGIPVIRGLRDSKHFDVRIIGLAYENLEPGIYMHDLVDKSYQIPYPTVGHETLLSRLEYIHQQENIDVIIPNFDAELFSFIKMGDALNKMGIKHLLPTVEQFDGRLKGRLNEFGEKYDINVPAGSVAYNLSDLKNELDNFEYPVVIKGKFYEASIAYSFEQAKAYFLKISAKWGTPIIIQQFVKGDEYNVTGLGNANGKLIGAVPMRKTYITDAGKAWAGISIADEELVTMAKEFVENTGWRGGFELELIKEEKTGKIYLIEINPRFPAWVYLAVGCGQNHPEALVRIAMGEDIKPFSKFEVSKMFVRYSYDMICDINEFEKISTLGEL